LNLTAASTLSAVALAVGSALRAEGIRAILTGGACVSLYTRGVYHSEDIDLVLETTVTRGKLDEAMETMGFSRRGDRYEHPHVRFYVEFPPGPLAIGDDLSIQPVEIRRSGVRALTLSATDCCRDRLAAFYHWNDRQSLRNAVLVALRNRVRMRTIQAWSLREGATAGFEEFREELRRARRRRRHRRTRG
jgi:hypothetical protein